MIYVGLQLCFLGISVYCVINTVARETILGGQIANIDDFPYQVALIISGDDECGGAIIDEFHVLTAAHCIIGEDGKIIKDHVTIVAGTHSLKKSDEQTVKVKVKKIFALKEFHLENKNVTGDIAVLKVQHPFNFKKHKHLKPIELPTKENEHYLGKTAKIAGFGWDFISVMTMMGMPMGHTGGNMDNQLHYIEAQVIQDKDCDAAYAGEVEFDFNKQLCARVKQHNNGNPSGICMGDSGGPLVLDGKTVIGVLSQGSPNCNEEKKTGVYTRVSHYLSFIENARHDRHHEDIVTHVYNL